MPLPNPSIAFALFDDKTHAEAAVDKLRDAGFAADQVELTGRDDGPAEQAARDIFSPVRTLLLGGDDSGTHLYDHLVELGIDAEEAQYFREQVDGGKVLVTVISMRREREAAETLREQGGRGAFETEPSAGAQGEIREDVGTYDAGNAPRNSLSAAPSLETVSAPSAFPTRL